MSLIIKSLCMNQNGDPALGSLNCRKDFATPIQPSGTTQLTGVFVPRLLNATLNLKIEIENTYNYDMNVEIKIEETSASPIFGTVTPKIVTFKKNSKTTLNMEIESMSIKRFDKETKKIEGKLTFKYVDIFLEESIGQTSYTVYTLFDKPLPPWDSTSGAYSNSNINYIWTDLLDVCCEVYKNYSGIQADKELRHLEAYTKELNSNSRFQYDTDRGACYYTVSATDEFKLQKYINNRKIGGLYPLNCKDCATIISTKALATGIDCTMGKMTGTKGFDCNPIMAIGFNDEKKDWKSPFNGGFSYHQVAVQGSATRTVASKIYDACLKLDAGDFPGRAYDASNPDAKKPYLPLGYTFAETTDMVVRVPPAIAYDKHYYRERLVRNQQSCILQPFVYKVPGFSNATSLSERISLPMGEEFIEIVKKMYQLEKNPLPPGGNYSAQKIDSMFENMADINSVVLTEDDGREQIYMVNTNGRELEIRVCAAEDEQEAYALLVRALSCISSDSLRPYVLGDISFAIADTLVIFVKRNVLIHVIGPGATEFAKILEGQISGD